MKKAIKFHDMRMNVLGNLISLGDKAHQVRTWVNHEEYDSFDEVVHCLFDDRSFEREPIRTVGELLFDATEADRIKSVIKLIDKLFQTYGKALSDADYIAKPEWPEIMASARAAVEAMKQNDLCYMNTAERTELYRKYNITE